MDKFYIIRGLYAYFKFQLFPNANYNAEYSCLDCRAKYGD